MSLRQVRNPQTKKSVVTMAIALLLLLLGCVAVVVRP